MQKNKWISLNLALILVLLCQCTNTTKVDNMEKDKKSEACCKVNSKTDPSETSEITCPHCGHKKIEKLPTEVCVIKYTCEKCHQELTPKKGDCCVFCTYGSHKCPSMQE